MRTTARPVIETRRGIAPGYADTEPSAARIDVTEVRARSFCGPPLVGIRVGREGFQLFQAADLRDAATFFKELADILEEIDE